MITTLVTAALLTSRPVVSSEARQALDSTLPTSDGKTVALSSLRGTPVILYFNEGAGCDSCIIEMAEIEREPGFAEAGITVLPIVMNTAEQINRERERLGVSSPFLLDDGTVSAECPGASRASARTFIEPSSFLGRAHIMQGFTGALDTRPGYLGQVAPGTRPKPIEGARSWT